MATRVNRAATAGNKKGGKPKRRNRTTLAFDTHRDLDAPENQSVFLAHNKESVARRHREMAGEEDHEKLEILNRSRGVTPRFEVSRVKDMPPDQPGVRRKKSPSGRGISGGRIYIAAPGERSKPKRSGWSRG